MTNTRQDEQDIERLLNVAGKRSNPPAEMRERVYAATLQAWQALPEQSPDVHVAETPRRSFSVYLATAASTLLSLGVAYLLLSGEPMVENAFAKVTKVRGEYLLAGRVTVGLVENLHTGATVQTQDTSMVSLKFDSGVLLTVDGDTQLVLLGPERVQLIHGRIYVDAAGEQARMRVQTRFSEIVDIGTQFEVSVADNAQMTVAVREGRVQISGDGQAHMAQAVKGVGDVVTFNGPDMVAKSQVATNDARWDWRRAGRAPYALAGSSVYDYVQWMARDSGNELRFASQAVEQMAKIGFLQGAGSLRNSDDTDIQDALATTRFQLEVSGESQWVVRFRD